MDVRVELLSADSPLVDTVVSWHWREWSEFETGTLDEWRARLRTRSNPDRVPFTLLASIDLDPVGCVSVCEDDRDARFADGGPWLSGMFVVGRARNLGVGRELVRTAGETARRFGATELRLYTSEAGAFYERCGWSYLHHKERPSDNSVMRRDL